jgi:hypothetical protein
VIRRTVAHSTFIGFPMAGSSSEILIAGVSCNHESIRAGRADNRIIFKRIRDARDEKPMNPTRANGPDRVILSGCLNIQFAR